MAKKVQVVVSTSLVLRICLHHAHRGEPGNEARFPQPYDFYVQMVSIDRDAVTLTMPVCMSTGPSLHCVTPELKGCHAYPFPPQVTHTYTCAESGCMGVMHGVFNHCMAWHTVLTTESMYRW